MKKIAILGSTGFIGRQALQVVEKYPDRFQVVALTANTSADLLISQAKKFGPKFVGVCDGNAYGQVKASLDCEVGCGEESLLTAASVDCDIVLVAVVGCVGLKSVMAAIKSKHTVALANKESLVAAGELVMRTAKKENVRIIPVDSEHSAIWQCLGAGRMSDVKRLILTASGGPFYNKTKDELRNITPEQAIKHPTWSMGKKISVDSATMMNKGLEIIEARWLFDTMNIDYVIHPQSIIHSMVEFTDGATIAQLSYPDMRLPIQLAFTYPERIPTDCKPLPLGELTFLPPKEDIFPLPALAKTCISIGGTASAIFNSANEAAVKLFFDGKISFTQITDCIEKTVVNSNITQYTSIDEILDVHHEIYAKLMKDYNSAF